MDSNSIIRKRNLMMSMHTGVFLFVYISLWELFQTPGQDKTVATILVGIMKNCMTCNCPTYPGFLSSTACPISLKLVL